MLRYRHHFIDLTLDGEHYSQTALADVDGDGLPEFILGEQYGTIWWYKPSRSGPWQRHTLGYDSPSDVGAVAIDVDGDGRVDFVTGGAWYRNPGGPENQPFERFVFDAELTAVHDVAAGDIDGDGRLEIVTMSDQNNLRWYKIPDDPTKPWERHDIGPAVHAGVSLGDVDGDGSLDIVRSDVWLENVNGDGAVWATHPLGHFGGASGWEENATVSAVCDINGDGRMDIVMAEAEIKGARIYWLENLDGKGREWKKHALPHGDAAARGAYHTLVVADFDGDGDPDVFSCEMEGVPGDRQPRFFLWENTDGKGTFREHVILDAGLGGHMAVIGDLFGDGAMHICSKLWEPRSDNAAGGAHHVDFLECCKL